MKLFRSFASQPGFLSVLAALLGVCSSQSAATLYVQTNLVSDLPGLAAHTDPNLANPWGIASSATSPFWVADNRTGLSTLYNSAGVPLALVVTVSPPLGGTPPSAPTGVVFNSTSSFGGSRFIFSTEDGTINAWNGVTTAPVVASTPDAVYKGIAIGTVGAANFLYAANFHAGTIDVFNSGWPVRLQTPAVCRPVTRRLISRTSTGYFTSRMPCRTRPVTMTSRDQATDSSTSTTRTAFS